MLTHETVCETSAMPVETDVSFPYALGITMVLSPKGILSEHTAQMTALSGRKSANDKATIPMAGITARRRTVEK